MPELAPVVAPQRSPFSNKATDAADHDHVQLARLAQPAPPFPREEYHSILGAPVGSTRRALALRASPGVFSGETEGGPSCPVDPSRSSSRSPPRARSRRPAGTR